MGRDCSSLAQNLRQALRPEKFSCRICCFNDAVGVKQKAIFRLQNGLVRLGVDIVTALCDLHRAKVVHRDLKPDNIILEPIAGGRRRAVIVDLGVGRLDADASGDEPVTSLTDVPLALGAHEYVFSVLRAVLPGGAPAYLIDCPALYARGAIYTGDPDEHLRFLALTRAALLACRIAGITGSFLFAQYADGDSFGFPGYGRKREG